MITYGKRADSITIPKPCMETQHEWRVNLNVFKLTHCEAYQAQKERTPCKRAGPRLVRGKPRRSQQCWGKRAQRWQEGGRRSQAEETADRTLRQQTGGAPSTNEPAPPAEPNSPKNKPSLSGVLSCRISERRGPLGHRAHGRPK